ncbi:uncharacterized protein LOC103510076 isoform X1 [Diaphorina citri]|uniref:Uncharacterized protein LOC103510076 isoform X1 n=1 Tax=Diaphorina citri TaxID=121845 RepID=A0A3Q0IUU1_DIACI|nr:uncharacterized protein LOC103510076 isoform X1 [Diaphorina citri]
MTSKLRRPPLFTYTNGTRCVTAYTPQMPPQYPQPPPVPLKKKVFSKTTGGMECSIASNYTNGASPGAPNERTAGGPKAGLHVNFIEKGEVKEKREKFLTAKYGSHQMSLIRKRLAVEMWLYDELQKLYEIPVSRVHCF